MCIYDIHIDIHIYLYFYFDVDNYEIIIQYSNATSKISELPVCGVIYYRRSRYLDLVL
jgi:hypothetical protein